MEGKGRDWEHSVKLQHPDRTVSTNHHFNEELATRLYKVRSLSYAAHGLPR